MKVLVTGSDGFIGSSLVEALVSSGFNVRAFVCYNSFNSWGWLDHLDKSMLNDIDIFQGDVRDPNGVREAMKGCDAVVHLAALIGIPYSYHSPYTYIDTNVVGTLNILQAAKDLDIEKVIHTSTSEVYGTAEYVPIDEKHPLQGQSPYSASKIAADQLAYSFYASFETPVITIRPFNTYGPRQSARAVIPTIITQINNGADRLRLGALSPTRDFNFIADTVSGFICALKANSGFGEVINLGSNFEISIGETANLISKIMGSKLSVVHDDERLRPQKSEVQRLWADNAKAKRVLNWEPKYSGLDGFELGLSQTIDWFCNDDNSAKYKHDIYNV